MIANDFRAASLMHGLSLISSKTMKESLMYKMSYYRYVHCLAIKAGSDQLLFYRFSELFGGGQAVDRVRNQVIPNDPIQLDTIGKSTLFHGDGNVDSSLVFSVCRGSIHV
jgi:hypothetical protein